MTHFHDNKRYKNMAMESILGAAEHNLCVKHCLTDTSMIKYDLFSNQLHIWRMFDFSVVINLSCIAEMLKLMLLN